MTDISHLEFLPSLINKIGKVARVKALQPPFNFPAFAIKQHWHERYQQDQPTDGFGRWWRISSSKN